MISPDSNTAGKRMPERPDWVVALALGAFLAFVYLLTYSGVPHNPDEWFYLTGTQAAVDGDWRSIQSHGWLFSLLMAPFYVSSMIIPGLGSFQAVALMNIVITALTAVLLFLGLSEFALPRGLRLVTALIFGLGTLAWPYSHYLFREPAAGLFLLAAVWGTIRFSREGRLGVLLAAGVAFGGAVAVKQTLLAFLPFLALPISLAVARLWLPRLTVRGRVIAGLITVGAIVGAVVWGARHAVQLARLLPDYVRHVPDLSTFAALWISPGWGLLIFAPALVLAVIGAVGFARNAPTAAFVALGGSLFYVLESTTNPYWWGYWAFGPRQLVPLIPLLCLPIPFGLRWLVMRWGRSGMIAASVLVGLSGLVQLVGVLSPFNEYVRRELFGAGLTGPAVTWRWDLWPIAGMLRFLKPKWLDIAWLTGRNEGAIHLRWPIVVGLSAAALLCALWLWWLMRPVRSAVGRSSAWVSLALCIAWAPVALMSVRGVYLDQRYQPDLGYPAAAKAVREGRRAGDLLVMDLWTENLSGPTVAMLNYCRGGCPRRLDLVRETLVDREKDWQVKHLADLAGFSRAWLVLERVVEGDPNSIIEQWLGQVGYLDRCEWTGPQVRLCRYGLGPAAPIGQDPAGVVFGDTIMLRSAEIGRAGDETSAGVAVRPGDQLLIDLAWEALDAPVRDYVASIQLFGPDGSLVTGADSQPGNGFRPTSSWRKGDRPTDRRSLGIPDAADAGTYRLSLVLYDPSTGQRLPVRSADGLTGDSLPLLTIDVGS